jgi:hypothetical protein
MAGVMNSVLLFSALICVAFMPEPLRAGQKQLLADSSFEETPEGQLATGSTPRGWEVHRTRRSEIQDKLIVRCVTGEDVRQGKKALLLGLPKETIGFEFVTLGQRLGLEAEMEYEASAWVRWKEGPAEKPPGATQTSGTPSAIVSFWVRHNEGTGDFAGRDEWLFDNHWKQLRFRFRATHPDQRSLVYVSLLPNQVPRQTTVVVDDFLLTEVPSESGVESRTANLIQDGGFDAGADEKPVPPWYFANMGGDKIAGKIVARGDDRFFRVAMNDRTSNLESAQLWQHVSLQEGSAYEVSCRMRWENRGDRKDGAIVNFGFYHEPSNTWYGPIDQTLKPADDWVTYRFTHIPPHSGPWKLYVQLNGWGNFGRGLAVSFDEFVCRRIKQLK